ncbi:PHP domain-containing protein [Kribbella deserti]|uniref:PHP domain-containing protein n=1 Tax=Kribbella deserti TaxID=1926257 RepID=A0ABV6QFX3_9ACTN
MSEQTNSIKAGSPRRSFLRGAGLTGAGVAAAVLGSPSVAAAPAAAAAPASAAAPAAAAAPVAGSATAEAGQRRSRRGGYLWLAGDHHLHSQYSNDAMFRVDDQVQRAIGHGLDWMVITDHGNTAFSSYGVPMLAADVRAARNANIRDILVFLGMEWNVPGAEHATLMLAPGKGEAAFLQQFVSRYDARVTNTRDGTPANEALALEAIRFLRRGVRDGRIPDALVLANHPSRLGIDSPHELRAWRDTAPEIVLGMEGAPGHQAAGLPAPGMARGRGLYDGGPGKYSFPGLPAEAYRTHGGFDWMTATVGGVWDSMLAEGKPFWITVSSDGHQACGDWVRNPVDKLDQSSYDTVPYDETGRTFMTTGRFPDPVGAGRPVTNYSGLPPGAYSKTWLGTTGRGHRHVMDAIRAGRIWVCHGDLISGLDFRLHTPGNLGRPTGDHLTGTPTGDHLTGTPTGGHLTGTPTGGHLTGTPIGGRATVRRGSSVRLSVDIELTETANYAQLRPRLGRVDLIMGRVTGPVADRDTMTAPDTRVIKSWDVTQTTGTLKLSHTMKIDGPCYFRLRGTDGNRTTPGPYGAHIDPHGPVIDTLANADPWQDLWFYTNPIFTTT